MTRGDLARLRVPLSGALTETGDVFEPFRLVDGGGQPVVPVTGFLRNLQAAGRSEATQRSYATDLLRWFRFTWAAGFEWDQATRAEARDFCRWLQLSGKPERDHWRTGRPAGPGSGPAPGTVNAVTGKASPGPGYAARDGRALRDGLPVVLRLSPGDRVRAAGQPVPAGQEGPAGRMRTITRWSRSGRSGPGCSGPGSRSGSREGSRTGMFDELFASLPSNRDRALVAFWVSTGARASELLGVTRGSTDPGSQLVTVIRKGSRAMQPLPASPDAFVWLRLYQEETHGLVPAGPDDPLWWTLRRPFRPLSYHAARAMFTRAGASLGANWSLHDIRHSAAYRMARDPEMPITDVQWVLGHVHLSTTQIYVTPTAGGRHRERRRPSPPPGGEAVRPSAGRAGLPGRVAGRAVREARVTAPGTAATQDGSAPLRPRMRPEAASALLEKFPPRSVPDTWEATALSRAALTGRLLAPPYAETPWQLNRRRLALRRFLGWLERHPGRHLAAALAGQRDRRRRHGGLAARGHGLAHPRRRPG